MVDRGTSWGAKIMTGAAVAIVLSFGLCGGAIPVAGKSSNASGILFVAGLVCLGLSFVLLVIGVIVMAVESRSGRV